MSSTCACSGTCTCFFDNLACELIDTGYRNELAASDFDDFESLLGNVDLSQIDASKLPSDFVAPDWSPFLDVELFVRDQKENEELRLAMEMEKIEEAIRAAEEFEIVEAEYREFENDILERRFLSAVVGNDYATVEKCILSLVNINAIGEFQVRDRIDRGPAIMVAIARRNYKMALMLGYFGPNLKIKSASGKDIMWILAETGVYNHEFCIATIKMLILQGANTKIANPNGKPLFQMFKGPGSVLAKQWISRWNTCLFINSQWPKCSPTTRLDLIEKIPDPMIRRSLTNWYYQHLHQNIPCNSILPWMQCHLFD